MPRAGRGTVVCARIDLSHVKPGYECPLRKTEFVHNYKRSGPYRDEDLKRAAYMDDMIADPVRLYAMTGMTAEMFDLTAHKVRVWKATGRGFLMWEDVHRKSDGGNRGKLNVNQALLMTLSYKLVYNNQSRTAAAFYMNQSTVHRYLKMMNEALADVLPTASRK